MNHLFEKHKPVILAESCHEIIKKEVSILKKFVDEFGTGMRLTNSTEANTSEEILFQILIFILMVLLVF